MQKLFDCLGNGRLREEVALGQFAASSLEQIHLRSSLDPFSNDLQAETMGEHDNDTNDFVGREVSVYTRDERSGRSLACSTGKPWSRLREE